MYFAGKLHGTVSQNGMGRGQMKGVQNASRDARGHVCQESSLYLPDCKTQDVSGLKTNAYDQQC